MLGPLGIRVNQWMNYNGEVQMRSAFRKEFSWNERVVWGRCPYSRCPKLIETYPDSLFNLVPDAIDIGENCYCGIYAAKDEQLARVYVEEWGSAVFCLVEGLGTVYVHDEGFRASGVQIVKVIHMPAFRNNNRHYLTLQATARHYGVGIVEWSEAKAAIDLQYERYLDQFSREEQENGRDSGL